MFWILNPSQPVECHTECSDYIVFWLPGLVWCLRHLARPVTLDLGFVYSTHHIYPTSILSPSQFMVKRAHEPVESPWGKTPHLHKLHTKCWQGVFSALASRTSNQGSDWSSTKLPRSDWLHTNLPFLSLSPIGFRVESQKNVLGSQAKTSWITQRLSA